MKRKSNFVSTMLITTIMALAVLTTATASQAQTLSPLKKQKFKLQQNKAKLSVSVKPAKGTSGTLGTITASGVTPGCTHARLEIQGSGSNHIADNTGKLVKKVPLTGSPNTDVKIVVLDYCITGIPPQAQTVFKIVQTPKLFPQKNGLKLPLGQ